MNVTQGLARSNGTPFAESVCAPVENPMRVLFIDDEPNILSALARLLRSMRGKWDMVFVQDARAALACIKDRKFDVIVSDMKMPGMDGAALLSAVKSMCPNSIRIALSGETDSHMIHRCIKHAHQYLAKPCEAEVLISTVERACALRELMTDEQLKALLSELSTLPSLPEAYNRIMQELQCDDPSLQKIAQIVETDAAMSAKILQLVNSAFFGIARRISTPAEAATFLGVDVIKALVLSTGVFAQFENSKRAAERLSAIWNHSFEVATLAREIATDQSGQKVSGDYAFIGGLLADVGKLVFAANFSKSFDEVEDALLHSDKPDWQVEKETIGHNHMDVGAYLIGLWGLPNPVVECVAYHHQPSACIGREFSALSAVHIATSIVNAA
jgi:HD-like signal output (HDOD) protein